MPAWLAGARIRAARRSRAYRCVAVGDGWSMAASRWKGLGSRSKAYARHRGRSMLLSRRHTRCILSLYAPPPRRPPITMMTSGRPSSRAALAWGALMVLCAAPAPPAGAVPPASSAPPAPRISVLPAHADTLAQLRKLVDRVRYRRVDSLATAFAARLERRTPRDSLALARCLDLQLDARAHSGDPLRPEWIKTARRAVTIKERALGRDHPELAVSLNRLGTLLADDFQLAAAEPFYRRALALNTATYGPDHPEVARVLVNLAILEREHGDWKQAKADYQRAMAIWDAALKADF